MKLKFTLLGDPLLNPVLIEDANGAYTAPSAGVIPHRFYYDAETDSIKDLWAGKTDRQGQKEEHEQAIKAAVDAGLTPPPPLDLK